MLKKLVVYHTMFLFDFSNDMEVTTPRNRQFRRYFWQFRCSSDLGDTSTWRTSKDRRKEEKGQAAGNAPTEFYRIRMSFSKNKQSALSHGLHWKKHCASRQNFAVPNGWPKVRPVDRWHVWRFRGWYGKHGYRAVESGWWSESNKLVS